MLVLSFSLMEMFPTLCSCVHGRIGFLVGFMFSSVMLSIVTAATNTIVVCLAESPAAFKINHPDESKRLESVWKEKSKSWLFY